MGIPSLNLRRQLLAWDRPLLPQAVAWLAGDWAGGAPLDLSAVLTIVPTRQSGRRLREALAEHAAAKGQAVFPPRVHTPDTLLAEGEGPDVASRLEALLAWVRVLHDAELAALPDVFPVEPPATDFAWAWPLAENFHRLQSQLTEGGLEFADVAARAGDGFPEAERWRQLAELERRQIDVLRALGRREPHAARREFARHPARPAGVDRVVLLGAPDPLPLALEVLAKWAEVVPVEIAVFAGGPELEHFDAWGRPNPESWGRREIELPEFERRVHLCADPADEAKRVAEVVTRYGVEADGRIALGVADPEVLPILENELSRAGIASYNPEGRVRRTESLHALLTALAAFGREPTFDALAAVARCPDFLTALLARMSAGASAARWLAALDELRAHYLPADLADAVRTARQIGGEELRLGFGFLAELHGILSTGAFPANAVAALELIFRSRRLDLSRDDDEELAAAIEAWRATMHAGAQAAEFFPELRPEDWWTVALRSFGEGRRAEEKRAGALDLQGWLELLWEDAPHLAVAGLNDGLVPDAIVGDAFLPESLRAKLGLKTNDRRFARDAYVLAAIVAARRRAGRVDLWLTKTSSAGDPLRPSRLLLRCADDELPRRVAFLFREVEATRANLPWTRAWRLAPRRAPPPERVAVTGLRAWLACPFRFYLAHVLRMEAVDPLKTELDARDFGTLCHAALEAMAREPALRDETDEHVLREFLLASLDRAARERFGERPTLPLVVQLESARQRLSRAAAVQARERAAGWTIERVEWEFALEVSGLRVRGKIDRVDRHAATGAWRVLDYKTSDAFAPPHKTHLRAARAGDEHLPEWMRVVVGERELVWADLQLPMYLRAMAAAGEAGHGSAGYFNLPKAVGETAVALWPELTPELLAAADACADGVTAAIRAGKFWPPAEMPPERDPFAELFHHGTAESVAWESGASILPARKNDGRLEAGATS